MTGVEFWLTDFVEKGVCGLADRKLAVDIGANIGTWTVPLSGRFESVVAFEPDSRASSRIPVISNVAVINAAVAGSERTATLYMRPSPEQTSLLEDHPIGAGGGSPAPVVGEVQVSCVTLDQVFPDGADFVKMDIEGGEVDALRGCVDAARWSRTFFVVECHDTFDEVLPELARLGKSVTRIAHPLNSHPGHCWAIGK